MNNFILRFRILFKLLSPNELKIITETYNLLKVMSSYFSNIATHPPVLLIIKFMEFQELLLEKKDGKYTEELDKNLVLLFRYTLNDIINSQIFINDLNIVQTKAQQQILINLLNGFSLDLEYLEYLDEQEIKALFKSYSDDYKKIKIELKKYISRENRDSNKRFLDEI